MDKKINLQMNKKNCSASSSPRLAFTLAEMTIVLLVASIITAAFLPLLTRRQFKAATAKTAVWTKMANNTDIYNTAVAAGRVAIGTNNFVAGDSALLLLNTQNNTQNHILFEQNNNKTGFLTLQFINAAGPNINFGNPAVNQTTNSTLALGTNASTKGNCDIAIGTNSGITSNNGNSIAIGAASSVTTDPSIAIGNDASSTNTNAIAIGNFARANGFDSIAIGPSAFASATNSIAIGRLANQGHAVGDNSISIGLNSYASGTSSVALGISAYTNADYAVSVGAAARSSSSSVAYGFNAEALRTGAVAFGSNSRARGDFAIAIGDSAFADGTNSIAIGKNAWAKGSNSIAVLGTATNANDIMLGSATTIVVIAGTLQLEQLGPGAGTTQLYLDASNNIIYNTSDLRLKKIIGPSKAGLEQIRKLKTYNYSYKSDKEKRPIVGVIAQDLQKIFPNAVQKDNGVFLTIRQEDIFYAMLNSIKQLDIMIQKLNSNVKHLSAQLQKIDEKISDVIKNDQLSNKEINELEARRIKLETRVTKLEKISKNT